MDELKTVSSLHNLRSYQSSPARRSEAASERKPTFQGLFKNNYKFFPKRSLLTKPHCVNNTRITLNLFGKKMIDNETRISVLVQSLYKQLSESRQVLQTAH
jgi:hypothetical protein